MTDPPADQIAATIDMIERAATHPLQGPDRPWPKRTESKRYVYVLCHPPGRVRYVGCSSDPLARLKQHRSAQTRVGDWLRGLPEEPRLNVICEVSTDEDWREVEQTHITAAWLEGHDLLNVQGAPLGVFNANANVDLTALVKRTTKRNLEEALDSARRIVADLEELLRQHDQGGK